MGRVVELTVEEGDQVEEGQVLLSIDPRQVEAAVARGRATLSQSEAQVAQQRANLDQSTRELQRLRELQTAGVVTVQEVEAAETRVAVQEATLSSSLHGVEQARAALEEASEQLSRTTIRAPISGRVIRLNIKAGETAVVGTMNNAGSLLLTIGDLSVVEAVMVLDETDIPVISVGDSAVVGIDAFPTRTFAARVSSIGNSAIQTGSTSPQSRGSVSFEVVLTLLDPPIDLRPDLSATADIIVDRRHKALAVPIISVTTREAGSTTSTDGADDDSNSASSPIARASASEPEEGVFALRDGRAVWTPVTLGITGQEHFEILSGLALGDTVVSGPYQTIRSLTDGDPVRAAADAEPSP
jgi:HlyD family secretion protein